MPIEAVLDRIIVRVVNIEGVQKTRGGLFFPGGGEQKIGEVVACGPGKPTMTGGVINPPGVRVGDTVMFHPESGHPISVDGENLVVLVEENIFGVLTPIQRDAEAVG